MPTSCAAIRRRWKKSCAAWTISFARARFSKPASRTWWIARANTLAELQGWTQFIGLQIEYSLIERKVERELIPMSKALNLGSGGHPWRKACCPGSITARVRPTEGG
jgi:hypothetical protein